MFSSEFCEIFKNTFFHRTPLVAASEIKSKTVKNGNSRKNKESFFVSLVLSERIFFNICVSPQCCIEYTFRIYILLHIKKHYFIHFYCLFLKSSKAFSVSFRSKSLRTNKLTRSLGMTFDREITSKCFCLKLYNSILLAKTDSHFKNDF